MLRQVFVCIIIISASYGLNSYKNMEKHMAYDKRMPLNRTLSVIISDVANQLDVANESLIHKRQQAPARVNLKQFCPIVYNKHQTHGNRGMFPLASIPTILERVANQLKLHLNDVPRSSSLKRKTQPKEARLIAAPNQHIQSDSYGNQQKLINPNRKPQLHNIGNHYYQDSKTQVYNKHHNHTNQVKYPLASIPSILELVANQLKLHLNNVPHSSLPKIKTELKEPRLIAASKKHNSSYSYENLPYQQKPLNPSRRPQLHNIGSHDHQNSKTLSEKALSQLINNRKTLSSAEYVDKDDDVYEAHEIPIGKHFNSQALLNKSGEVSFKTFSRNNSLFVKNKSKNKTVKKPGFPRLIKNEKILLSADDVDDDGDDVYDAFEVPIGKHFKSQTLSKESGDVDFKTFRRKN